MYLSYSGYDTYRKCPRMYWHQYVDKTPKEPENRVNMLYGSTVGTIFEQFYEDKVWRSKEPITELLSRVDGVLDEIIRQETTGKRGGVIQWKSKEDKRPNYASREELVVDINDAIPRGIEIIRANRLLGPVADAEVVLDSEIKGHKIAGRADFIIQRMAPDNDLIILDGKGSRHRDKYVSEDQLQWYAALYNVKFGRLPDKVGFIFWRWSVAESMEWFPVNDRTTGAILELAINTCNTIEASKRRLAMAPPEARDDMVHEEFTASIGPDCKLCSYTAFCARGKAYLESIEETKGVGVNKFVLGLDDLSL